MTRCFRIVSGLMATSALALTLGACKLENRPLFGRDEARAAYDAAPPLGPLDPAAGQPLAYLPAAEAYAYPERAYAVSRAAYQRPPSYAFAYEDEQPWAWEAADEGLMFAEPYGDDWRYYYYEPGEDYPYYVQDADYGYAYGDDGVLLALFTAAGALIAADRYDDYAPRAGYYWTRAHDLNRSYYRAPRYRVDETVWRERSPAVFRTHDRWHRAFESQPAWREAARQDNGRHLGWRKDRRERDDRRALVMADPPQRSAPIRSEGRGDGRDDRGWREGREARHARVENRLEREDRRGRPVKEARHEPGPQREGRQAQARAQGHENRGGGVREARQERGPKHQARDAGSHGREAGWRSHDRPQAQQGGGHGRDGGEKGGGKNRGHGGGHGKDGGGGGQDQGGGRGGGKGGAKDR